MNDLVLPEDFSPVFAPSRPTSLAVGAMMSRKHPRSCTICGMMSTYQTIRTNNLYQKYDDVMTHPLCNCNDVCVAFKGLRIFDVHCVLPYPTLIRIRIEVLFGSKMFEGCYDWSLN